MIKKLFYTPRNGGYQQIERLHLSKTGIDGSIAYHHWRQLLILPISSLEKHNLTAGQLKENIVIDQPETLHDLPSGSVLKLGSAKVRLTFHCEPCAKLQAIITPRRLQHERGYLAQIIKAGEIKVGDKIGLSQEGFEAIPYAAADRIEWFLKNHPQAIYASDLVKTIGLPTSYCRALPQILKKRTSIDSKLILFKKDQ